MEERTKVVLYARVSTSAQDYTRQITELRMYAKKQNPIANLCFGIIADSYGYSIKEFGTVSCRGGITMLSVFQRCKINCVKSV